MRVRSLRSPRSGPPRALEPEANRNGRTFAVHGFDVPVVAEPSPGYFALKRAMDICAALILLALLAPLMAVLAVAIKATSPGPVLFKQERCGLRGRRFLVFKFRSMRRNAESRMHEVRGLDMTNGPTFKSPVDPRVTAVGRFMRRYSLDELPQLWHVLTGDMSLVGPRPLITRETEQLPPWALTRLAAKPGLTCIWQVSGRSLIPFEEWMELDLQYVESRSLWLDLKLLVKTPAAVLTGRGAF
jgi:lipopolysaccharide/colanic/teichoic acid biosynthesis glycosyltransferase